MRQRQHVQDGVRRAAHGHVERDRVVDRLAGHDVAKGMPRRQSPRSAPPLARQFVAPGDTAGMVPFPGSAMPSASHRQFIEFAVNMPEQLPQVGQAQLLDLQELRVVDRRRPHALPTASKTDDQVDALPARDPRPASIGPPETKIGGNVHARRAHQHPGHDLVAVRDADHAVEAVRASHRLDAVGDELARGEGVVHASWPMAMPSSTPMVLNSNGTPPAARTASFTTRPNSCRWTWPGMMSTYELQTAMNGLPKSLSVRRIWPVARSRLRCGARSMPLLDRVRTHGVLPGQ